MFGSVLENDFWTPAPHILLILYITKKSFSKTDLNYQMFIFIFLISTLHNVNKNDIFVFN